MPSYLRARTKTTHMTENEIAKIVVDSAIHLHKNIGPGLLESVYEVLLAHDLESKGLKVMRRFLFP